MLHKHIKTGDKVEISLENADIGSKSHISQVEHMKDEKNVIIHAPLSFGQVVQLPQGKQYSFMFFTSKGMARFKGRTVKFFKDGAFYFLQIQLLDEGEKVHRRDFFRFSCLLPFQFSYLTDEEENPITEGIIKDISGGGILFSCNTPMEVGRKIISYIRLNNDYLTIEGELLNREYFPKILHPYEYSVKFIDISPRDRENIIQFIFTQQRKSSRLYN